MRVEKTVFISYRRTDASWALALYQALTQHGYDVFFDYKGLPSGSFEHGILDNIRSRAHFVVVLTPSALDRCDEPGDWLRREIEEAIDCDRNIVPLMLNSFDFGAPGVDEKLTGKLAALSSYHGLSVLVEYFDAAMARLREQFLDVALDTALQPASETARDTVIAQQAAANAAPEISIAELTAKAQIHESSPDEKHPQNEEGEIEQPKAPESESQMSATKSDAGRLETKLTGDLAQHPDSIEVSRSSDQVGEVPPSQTPRLTGTQRLRRNPVWLGTAVGAIAFVVVLLAIFSDPPSVDEGTSARTETPEPLPETETPEPLPETETSEPLPETETSPPTGRLTVSVDQPGATVKIMNIKPEYHDGIELALNESFRIRVDKSGYRTYDKWIRMGSDEQVHRVEMFPSSIDPSIILRSETDIVEFEKISKNNDLAWHGKHLNSDQWGEYVMNSVQNYGGDLVSTTPKDVVKFCPNYHSLENSDKATFWVSLVAAISKYESGFDPDSFYVGISQGYVEKSKRGSIVKRGLMRIDIDSADYSKCGIIKAGDLHNPQINFECSIKIMNRLVKADGVIWGDSIGGWKGLSRFWDSLKIPDAVESIKNITRSTLNCAV